MTVVDGGGVARGGGLCARTGRPGRGVGCGSDMRRGGSWRGRRAFSLMEVTVAVAIVGGLLAAVLNTIGASATGATVMSDRARGQALALELLSEILPLPYQDPQAGAGTLGPGPGESTGTRTLFNDVDDYHGWSASPPQYRDGTVMSGFSGWTRGVQVQWVQVTSPDTVSASDTGVKRITITVKRGAREVTSVVALRTLAFDTMQ